MFRIAFLAEDRKLADVLRSLAGQAHNLEVVPVTIGGDATKVDISRAPGLQRALQAPKKAGAVNPHTGGRTEITPAALGMKKGDHFTYGSLKPLLKRIGLSEGSTWYATKRMVKEKTARQTAIGHYEVV